jgi:hypothetical protein
MNNYDCVIGVQAEMAIRSNFKTLTARVEAMQELHPGDLLGLDSTNITLAWTTWVRK